MYVDQLVVRDFRAFAGERVVFTTPPVRPDGTRLTVLAGPNGSGKTASLEAIATAVSRCLGYSLPIRRSWTHAAAEQFTIHAWLGLDEHEPGGPGTIALEVGPDEGSIVGQLSGGQSVSLFNRDWSAELPKVFYFSSFRRFPRAEVTAIGADPLLQHVQRDYALNAGEHGFPAIKQSLVVTEVNTKLGGKSREGRVWAAHARRLHGLMREVLQQAFNLEYVGVERVSNGYRALVKHAGDPDDAAFDIDELSSGQKEILAFTAYLGAQEPNNSIIMIDEPELHLHESLQRYFVDKLLKIGQGNHVILATHSSAIASMAIGDELVLLGQDVASKTR